MNEVKAFTNPSLRGYGYVILCDGTILVYSKKMSACWLKMTHNQSYGYTLNGSYYSQITLRSVVRTTPAVTKAPVNGMFIVFSEAACVSQMFKAGTSFETVAEKFKSRGIDMNESFKAYWPASGVTKAVVKKVVKVEYQFAE